MYLPYPLYRLCPLYLPYVLHLIVSSLSCCICPSIPFPFPLPFPVLSFKKKACQPVSQLLLRLCHLIRGRCKDLATILLLSRVTQARTLCV